MSLYNSMKYRMPWTVASSIMSRIGIPSGKGWERTIDKIENLKKAGEDLHELENDCLDEYKKHILYGEKNIKFYNASKGEIKLINENIDKMRVKNCSFTDNYPFIMNEGELKLAEPGFNLVDIIEEKNGRFLIFASKRYVEYRERTSNIPEMIQQQIGEIDEIIYIRHGVHQFFDAAWVPYKEGIIEIRADSPKDIADACDYAHKKIVHKLNPENSIQCFNSPLNLFPLIRKIYDNENEGYIVEMDFITNTASSKKEKMRKSKLDLRDERYHKAGSDAIKGRFDPYKLCVRWDNFDTSPHPELIIKGNSRTVHSTIPFIPDATIRWSSDEEIFKEITNIIFKYLEINES